MVEAKILKNGGKPIPGNSTVLYFLLRIVTVMDMYDALGDRLKRLRMDEPGMFYLYSPVLYDD